MGAEIPVLKHFEFSRNTKNISTHVRNACLVKDTNTSLSSEIHVLLFFFVEFSSRMNYMHHVLFIPNVVQYEPLKRHS